MTTDRKEVVVSLTDMAGVIDEKIQFLCDAQGNFDANEVADAIMAMDGMQVPDGILCLDFTKVDLIDMLLVEYADDYDGDDE